MSNELPIKDVNPMKRIDLYAEYAKEQFKLSPDWQIYKWEAFPKTSQDHTHLIVTGAVCNSVFTRGTRAGAPNWRKLDKTTEASFPIILKDYDNWLPLWEKKTGKCHVCLGTGQRWTGWNHIKGDIFVPCRRCKATGKASEIQAPKPLTAPLDVRPQGSSGAKQEVPV